MAKKKKKGEDQKKQKGSKGAGNANHKAGWNAVKALKNAVISNGYVESYLIALDAEDAGLPGIWNFRKLENEHETSDGKWEPGTASWMVFAKEALKAKMADPVALLMKIGKRYAGFNLCLQGDASMAHRRMASVSYKLDELGLGGSLALGKLEGEAMDGKLPWLLESIKAEGLRNQAEDDRKASEEASRRQAEQNAKKLAENRKK